MNPTAQKVGGESVPDAVMGEVGSVIASDIPTCTCDPSTCTDTTRRTRRLTGNDLGCEASSVHSQFCALVPRETRDDAT